MDEANEIITYINNHSWLLHRFYSEQLSIAETSGARRQALTLIRGCITRWATHVLSLNRLIDVWTALRLTVIKNRDEWLRKAGPTQRDKAYAQSILELIESTVEGGNPNAFYEKLKR